MNEINPGIVPEQVSAPKTREDRAFSIMGAVGFALAISICGGLSYKINESIDESSRNFRIESRSFTISKPATGFIKIEGNLDNGLHDAVDIRRCLVLGSPLPENVPVKASPPIVRSLYLQIQNDCYPDVPALGSVKIDPLA